MKAMILAAGLGTRLRPHTNHTPKALFSIAGRPLLDIIIRNLQQAGCTAVIINTHHLHQKIEAFVAEQKYTLPIFTRFEPYILGTGGAIKNVADFWDDRPFMVINGDVVVDINLKEIFDFHCSHCHPVTLVLCDDPEFNCVTVEQEKWIQEFHNPSNSSSVVSSSRLTFTGIQVLEPDVLKYIPENVYYSSIDAFKHLLADGKKIRAFIVGKDLWKDIGTPQRYKEAVFQKTMPLVFSHVFPDQRHGQSEIVKVKLKGDGSERQWYRLQSNHGSLVMVDHGIRQTQLTSEVDSFVWIGCHLHRMGVSVPKIYFFDTFAGLVFLEDLGDLKLQHAVQMMPNMDTIIRAYKPVIEHLVRLSQNGARGFDRSWTYQTPAYNQEVILEKECRYFVEAFLKAYLGFKVGFEDFQREFTTLAHKALQHPIIGFMHRDMQSRNIMVKDKSIYFIDFQGGRLGPIQYDLASLLIDPYVELPRSVQIELLYFSIEVLSSAVTLEPEKFLSCYNYCTLTRNLQILGAFGYLIRVKGKKHFQKYIPAAVRSLNTNLLSHGQGEFPGLCEMAQRVASHMKIICN
jgi:aminoglycoside/choline kinase family phosphotransferase/dTDP-glucose pyrophosphorylase